MTHSHTWRTKLPHGQLRAMYKRSQRKDAQLGARCASNKRCYATRARAMTALRDVRHQRRGAVDVKRAYHCPQCGNWHLTSSPHLTREQLRARAEARKQEALKVKQEVRHVVD
jgi:hypothetical protein